VNIKWWVPSPAVRPRHLCAPLSRATCKAHPRHSIVIPSPISRVPAGVLVARSLYSPRPRTVPPSGWWFPIVLSIRLYSCTAERSMPTQSAIWHSPKPNPICFLCVRMRTGKRSATSDEPRWVLGVRRRPAAASSTSPTDHKSARGERRLIPCYPRNARRADASRAARVQGSAASAGRHQGGCPDNTRIGWLRAVFAQEDKSRPSLPQWPRASLSLTLRWRKARHPRVLEYSVQQNPNQPPVHIASLAIARGGPTWPRTRTFMATTRDPGCSLSQRGCNRRRAPSTALRCKTCAPRLYDTTGAGG